MYDIVQARCDEVETSQECFTENICILVRLPLQVQLSRITLNLISGMVHALHLWGSDVHGIFYLLTKKNASVTSLGGTV